MTGFSDSCFSVIRIGLSLWVIGESPAKAALLTAQARIRGGSEGGRGSCSRPGEARVHIKVTTHFAPCAMHSAPTTSVATVAPQRACCLNGDALGKACGWLAGGWLSGWLWLHAVVAAVYAAVETEERERTGGMRGAAEPIV